jgi:ribosomal protein S18 acetylase RimI-like enzyme
MIIRNFTHTDFEAAHTLWLGTKGVCNCEKCMELDSAENLSRFIARNPASCFTAESDGEIIGTVLAGHDGRTGLIYRLTVSESNREKGLGKALVDKAVGALKREGIKAVTLFCLKDNQAGNAFWSRIGFIEMTEAKTYKLKV